MFVYEFFCNFVRIDLFAVERTYFGMVTCVRNKDCTNLFTIGTLLIYSKIKIILNKS